MTITLNSIFEELFATLEFSRKHQFYTIDLVDVAFHEAQIKLKKLLETSSDDERMQMRDKAIEILTLGINKGYIYDWTYDSNNNIIVNHNQSLLNDVQKNHQTLVFIRELPNILA